MTATREWFEAATSTPETLHPLLSRLPLAACVEDPIYLEVVAALGDPALVDERVQPMPAPSGPVVVGEPPTAPLALVPTEALPQQPAPARKPRARKARAS